MIDDERGRGEYIMEGEILFELFRGEDADPSCVIKQGLAVLTKQVGEPRKEWYQDISMSNAVIAEAILEYAKEKVLIDAAHRDEMLCAIEHFELQWVGDTGEVE